MAPERTSLSRPPEPEMVDQDAVADEPAGLPARRPA
jgi:hypothetical protein